MIVSDQFGSQPAVRIALKVVPGSRRTQIVGWLGERLKVKVAAPPEDGQANKAVCALLAVVLGINVRGVQVVTGLSHPEKTVRIEGLTVEEVLSRLG